ncbi:unnamed protein product [Chrysoparadoxa australica]
MDTQQKMKSSRRIPSKPDLASVLQAVKPKGQLAQCLTLAEILKLGDTSKAMQGWFDRSSNKAICEDDDGAKGEDPEMDDRERSPLLFHIRGRGEFVIYFTSREQEVPWAMHQLSPSSIKLDYHDSIDGPLPGFIGQITTLEWLDLGRSHITGTIPSNLGSLVNLRKLYLAGNELYGCIPDSLGNLSSLWELSLAGNQLSGPIPASFGNLVELEYLCLRDNSLSGAIPPELGNLKKLRELWLNSNQLTGGIPDSFQGLESVQQIYLNNNKLTEPLPENFGSGLKVGKPHSL